MLRLTPRLMLLAGFTLGSQLLAADVYVGAASVAAADRVSVDKIDHSTWDALLGRYVDGDGLVDYQAWKASAESMQKLDRYLATLSTANLRSAAAKNAKLAYWINAYNAVTIQGILREYPTSSIRNHTAKLWGYNIWDDLKLRVDGQTPSLNDIEHKTLRPLGDPRIHFAIVCASIGCPRLLNEAYVADRLNEQLEANSLHFFAQRQNFQADTTNKRVKLSSILSWFGEDFGDDQAAQLRRIRPWLPNEAAKRLVADSSVRVSYLDYDWDLNEQK